MLVTSISRHYGEHYIGTAEKFQHFAANIVPLDELLAKRAEFSG